MNIHCGFVTWCQSRKERRATALGCHLPALYGYLGLSLCLCLAAPTELNGCAHPPRLRHRLFNSVDCATWAAPLFSYLQPLTFDRGQQEVEAGVRKHRDFGRILGDVVIKIFVKPNAEWSSETSSVRIVLTISQAFSTSYNSWRFAGSEVKSHELTASYRNYNVLRWQCDAERFESADGWLNRRTELPDTDAEVDSRKLRVERFVQKSDVN